MSKAIDHRASLAEAQSRLTDALGGGEIPEGFDAPRVELAARILIDKRRRTVAHVLPMVAKSLGTDFAKLFEEYAGAVPHPPDGFGMRDAAGFLQTVATSRLNDPARLESLAFRVRGGSLVGAAWLGQRKQLILALRVPRLGIRLIRLPLSIGRAGQVEK